MDIKMVIEAVVREQLGKMVNDAIEGALTMQPSTANDNGHDASPANHVEGMRAALRDVSARRSMPHSKRSMARTMGYSLKRIGKGSNKGDAMLPGVDVPDRVRPALEALIVAAAKNPTAKVIRWKSAKETPALTIKDLMNATGRTSKQLENDVYFLRTIGVVERTPMGAK